MTRFIGFGQIAQFLDGVLCHLRHDFVYHGLVTLDALQKRLVGLRTEVLFAKVGLVEQVDNLIVERRQGLSGAAS